MEFISSHKHHAFLQGDFSASPVIAAPCSIPLSSFCSHTRQIDAVHGNLTRAGILAGSDVMIRYISSCTAYECPVWRGKYMGE